MCGIFGWVSGVKRSGAGFRDAVASSFRLLRHRGPDAHGMMFQRGDGRWCDREHDLQEDVPLFLGHVRLSILDLSPLGKQPMATADGRFRLSFNGEVYNYLELRRELEMEGVQFRTHTDTEVVLQAFARWGVGCLLRFTGMFAMAVHDDVEKKLYLIRDFFGIKPLYYHDEPGQVAFASELPVLLNFPGVGRTASSQRTYDYLLFGDYDSQQDTLIEGVRNLLPAHYMVVDAASGKIEKIKRYWQPDLSHTSSLSFDDAADKLRSMFLDNVRLHLRSDVPVGAALSGGVDSSAVTCAIRHLEPDMELPVFTFVAEGSDVNEERWADLVSAHTRADSHKVQIDPAEIVHDLDQLIRAQGEPFGSTSIYAQYRVFQLAHEAGIKVTMDGQGADEMFAGYLGFPGERLKTLILQGRMIEAWRFFNATSRWPDRNRKEVFKRMVGQLLPRSFYPLLRPLARGSLTPEWLDQEWLQERHVRFDMPRVDEVYSGRCYVRRELACQLTQRGLPALLRHGDRNSMHFSIESRVPFLTKELAEFAMSLPEEYLIAADGTTKALFKKAMRGIVPDAILDRRDKIGFATPELEWLSALDPWVREVLDGADELPFFHADALRQCWQEILAGRRRFDWQVWRWLNLIRWTQLNGIVYG